MGISRKLNYAWRFVATNLAFLIFGIGALIMTVTAFPAIHLYARLTQRDRDWACLRSQYLVHLGFQAFIWFMKSLGILTYEIDGREKLERASGRIVVANHPTLLDIVFLNSMISHAFCVVKKSAWTNPFLGGVMRAVGYIPNDDPFKLIEDCVDALGRGHNLVIFPEATRSVRGQDMKLKRGAASIIAMTGCSTIPVTITCSQPSLSKSDKWYLPAPEKMHFRLVVHETYDPTGDIEATDRLSLSNRRINRRLKAAFLMGGAN